MRNKIANGEKMLLFDFYLFYIKNTLLWRERGLSFNEFQAKYNSERAIVEFTYHDLHSGEECTYTEKMNQINVTTVHRMNHIFDVDITVPVKVGKKQFFKIIEYDEL